MSASHRRMRLGCATAVIVLGLAASARAGTIVEADFSDQIAHGDGIYSYNGELTYALDAAPLASDPSSFPLIGGSLTITGVDKITGAQLAQLTYTYGAAGSTATYAYAPPGHQPTELTFKLEDGVTGDGLYLNVGESIVGAFHSGSLPAPFTPGHIDFYTPDGDMTAGLATAQLSFHIVPDTPAPGGVPEPAAWSLMVAGFGLAGAALRRRRRAVCQAICPAR